MICGVGVHQSDLFVLKLDHLSLKLVRRPLVVCVQEGDQVPPRMPDANVAGDGWSPILLPNDLDTLPVGLDHLTRAVRRAVIYERHRERRTSLAQSALDGAPHAVT